MEMKIELKCPMCNPHSTSYCPYLSLTLEGLNSSLRFTRCKPRQQEIYSKSLCCD